MASVHIEQALKSYGAMQVLHGAALRPVVAPPACTFVRQTGLNAPLSALPYNH